MAFTPRNVISDISIPAPDFGLMAKSAQAVQSRYLEGFNKAQSYYKSLLNADITSKDNEQYRSEYFKKVNTYLTNISGVDFSNPANVKAATDLFQPLVKDKDFVTDLSWTSMQNAEKNKLDEVKNSTDEKVRSQYSPIMEKAMGYSYQDMQEAKRGDGSISKVGVQKYVPFQNIQNSLNQAAKDLNLNVSVDKVSGMYIITDKNGADAFPAFLQWSRQQMGNTFDEQLLVTGKVGVRSQLESMMQGDPKLTKEQAYQQIAKNNSLGIYKNFDDYKSSLNQGIQSINKQIDEIKSKHSSKVSRNDPDYQRVAQLKLLKKKYETELSGLDQSKSKDIETAFNQFMANPEYAMLPLLKDDIAKQWAQGYASTHYEHEIKENQVAMQLQRQSWEEAMAEKKQRWAQENIRLKEGLRFETDLALGKLKGEISDVATAPAEDGGVQDQYDMYQKDKEKLIDKAIQGYFNPTVLEIAAGSPNLTQTLGISYPTLSNSLKNVMDNFSKYGKDPSKNPQFASDYAKVLKFVQRINPRMTKISNVGDIMTVIDQGVAQYKGGNATKLKEARSVLGNAQQSFTEYVSLNNYEVGALKKLKEAKSDFYSFEYFDKEIYKTTGRLVPRADLSSATRLALIEQITPNFGRYSNKTGSKNTGFVVSTNPEKFNYNLIDEVIQNQKFVSDIANATELDTKKSEEILKTISNSGGEYSDIFNPNGMKAYKFTYHNKEYMKVTIPLKTDKDGNKKIQGIASGGITFYIPKEKALGMWKGLATKSIMGQSYQTPVSPDLYSIPNQLFQENDPVSWIHDGLSTSNRVTFPSYLKTTYGVSYGALEFDALKGDLYITLQADGKVDTRPIKIGGQILNRNDYNADPARYTNSINSSIIEFLSGYNDKKMSSLYQAEESHRLAMMNNPSAYDDVDDIESENENQNNEA
jgi:hypothetical protein